MNGLRVRDLILIAVGTVVLAGCGEVRVDPRDDSPGVGTVEAVAEDTHVEPTTSSVGAVEGVDPAPEVAVSIEVAYGGLTYECEDVVSGEWDCTRGIDTVYCSGRAGPDECSDLWYPNELDAIRLVTFAGQDYACAPYESACVAYSGGPLPKSFLSPDVWCEGRICTSYDPDLWFELTFDFQDHLCEPALLGVQHFACYLWSGSTPTPALQPDAYCSGPESFLTCSDLWYPDDLDQYEIISFGGGDYICEPALLGSYGDSDCGLYIGGDPTLVLTGQLKCTDRGYTFECDYGYYPSELDGLTITYIGTSQYVCQDSYGGSECFLYFGGSPADATWGLPDLYCNYSGLCDPDEYP